VPSLGTLGAEITRCMGVPQAGHHSGFSRGLPAGSSRSAFSPQGQAYSCSGMAPNLIPGARRSYAAADCNVRVIQPSVRSK
jgi:hypothetical protein